MLSIGLILSALFFGLRFLMPSDVDLREVTLSEKRFRRLYLLSYLRFFLGVPLFSLLLYLLTKDMGVENTPEYLYNLYPDKYFRIGVSVFGGVFLLGIAEFAFLKFLLKEEFQSYWSLYNNQYGFKATGLLKGLILFLGFLSLSLIILGYRSHFKVFVDKIEVSRLLEWPSRTYNYDQIKEINYRKTFIAPSGDVVSRPHFEIIFDDDKRWTTKGDVRETHQEDKLVFEGVSKRAGVEIKRIE